MDIGERLKFFEQNYDLIFDNLIDKGSKIYIGSKDDRHCRFCGEDNVTFKNVAHAIPEFLGNKEIILLEECDACNTLFSNQLENNLDKFTKPYRLIAKIKGKSKVPSYKTTDKKSRIDFHSDQGFKIIDNIDTKLVSISNDENKLIINAHLEPYIPTAVFKCLVKIALSLMPSDELDSFKHAIKWIREKDHSKKLITPQHVIVEFIPGPKPNKKLAAIVLRRKENVINAPYCLFIVGFGNFVYQLMVPSIKDAAESGAVNYSIPRFPTPFQEHNDYGECKYGVYDLSSHDTVTELGKPIVMSFDSMNIIKP